ncbi:outer membrane protein assembly factor BamB family protein [Nocardia sp. NPDC001965]
MDTAAIGSASRRTRKVWCTVLVVVVLTGIAVIVQWNRRPQERPETTVLDSRFLVSARLDSAPVPRWTLRAADLSDEPGAIRGDHQTDFEVTDAAVRDGVVSVTGRTEDRMTAVLTRGTVSDFDATWRRTYPVPAADDAANPRIDGRARDYVLDGHDRSIRVYDLRTGDPLFTGPVAQTFAGGIIATQVIDRGRSAGRVALVDRTGRQIVEVGNASFLLDRHPIATATPAPILTGESAYEQSTGRVRWTNPQLGIDEHTGRASAVEGVVGNTVIVRSPGGAELVGLDLADGHPVWQQPTPFSNTLHYDGVTDASHLTLTDGETVSAIDSGDGSSTWSVPLPPGGRPGFRTAVKAMGGQLVTVTAHEFTGYSPA